MIIKRCEMCGKRFTVATQTEKKYITICEACSKQVKEQ